MLAHKNERWLAAPQWLGDSIKAKYDVFREFGASANSSEQKCEVVIQQAFRSMATALLCAEKGKSLLGRLLSSVAYCLYELVTRKDVMECSRLRHQVAHGMAALSGTRSAFHSLSTLFQDEFALRELHDGLWEIQSLSGPVRQEAHWEALLYIGGVLAKFANVIAEEALDEIDEGRELVMKQRQFVKALQISKAKQRMLCKTTCQGKGLVLVKAEAAKMSCKLHSHLQELRILGVVPQKGNMDGGAREHPWKDIP